MAEFAKQQTEGRRPRVLTSAGSFDRIIEQEFEKGEIAGIELFMSFPDLLIEDLTDQKNDLKELLDENS